MKRKFSFCMEAPNIDQVQALRGLVMSSNSQHIRLSSRKRAKTYPPQSLVCTNMHAETNPRHQYQLCVEILIEDIRKFRIPGVRPMPSVFEAIAYLVPQITIAETEDA